ncbi:182 kDa tankyrase-1-binding protein isoform X2 [Etheostoma cragini]|uniref:182 kDa tankyrase-1-binding protein isoform X2 n=1 Tax=Etheostoma cragini TaxID=417921 RepID=UPI00155EE4BE|nr:182 kDa tankyrase-1-binding protein isoform X2 [Etheostoma cragini]
MESSIEISQTGGTSNPKPSVAPKPRLTPKPFSLQKNIAIRSIHAPKRTGATSKTATQQTGKSEASGVPKPPVATPALKLPQQTTTSDSKPSSVSVLTKDKPKPTKESKTSPYGEDTLDSSVGKSDPASQTAPPKETPKSEPIQRDDVIHANHKASTDIINSEQIGEKKTEDITPTSVVQMVEESGSDVSSTDNPEYQRGSSRKRLSMKLTSKFESAGLSPPPQPSVTVYTTTTKDEAHKPESSDPKPNQTTSGPSNDEDAPKEAYSGGGSIKRRISLLFDSSSRPEPMTKREEPEMLNGTGSVKGVKERIKTWATEIIPEGPKTEKKPQFAHRTRSKSFEPATAPTAEKTTKVPAEPSSTQTSAIPAVDLPLKLSPAEQSTETPMETSKDGLAEVKPSENLRETLGERLQSKSTEGDVKLRNHSSSTTHAGTDEGDSAESESAQHAPKRNDVKRRSVRFGIVERDDGGPPLILGSASDSSEEEEEDTSGDEAEEDIPVSVPVYKSVEGLQKKDGDEVREQEKKTLKHLEFEKRRRAKENELAGLKLEEERKQKEEEREKEKARQREDEERVRERLKEEEMERQRREEYEQGVLKEQEKERQRLKEEEMERERQLELMWQRQREEERERGKQKEERLKQDQEEREKERMKEEARKEERLREERERQMPKEDEERLIHSEEHRLEGKLREKEINRIKQRDEEWGKDWVKKTKMQRGEEGERDREKELELMWQRQKEEDRERATQKEERLRQEEREKERLRMEERETERQRMLKEQQEVKEEMEKKRQIEMERQKEEDRERVRQKEERFRQEEREKERLRIEAEERESERQRMLKEQQEKEELERMRQIEMERQKEEGRREEERNRQVEKERVEELERKMQEEMDRKRAQQLEEELRMEDERKREEPESEGLNLVSFDSEDVPQKSKSLYSPSVKAHETRDNQVEVVYDDFSVRPPLLKVDFDDFSVKPKRWGSQAKVETSPLIQSWPAVSVDKEEVEMLAPLDVITCKNKVPEQVEKPGSPMPTLAQERPEEEQVISMELVERGEEEETKREEEEETMEDEVDEEDEQEAPVNSNSTNDEDTDALIDNEPDQQNEACEQTSEIDSPKPVPDQVPEVSSEDVDTTDFYREPELAQFPESSTPLLDTSVQKSKADLVRRRTRTHQPRSLRGGLGPKESPDWRTRDSTDEKEASSKQRESDSDEDQPKAKIVCSPPPTSQRVPMFPGLSPAALMAQLKKRTGRGEVRGRKETEDDKGREEKESQNEEAASSPSQQSRSTRSAAHLAGAARVLPPLGSTDAGAISSPAWLKELKSKKRLSQYDSEA